MKKGTSTKQKAGNGIKPIVNARKMDKFNKLIKLLYETGKITGEEAITYAENESVGHWMRNFELLFPSIVMGGANENLSCTWQIGENENNFSYMTAIQFYKKKPDDLIS